MNDYGVMNYQLVLENMTKLKLKAELNCDQSKAQKFDLNSSKTVKILELTSSCELKFYEPKKTDVVYGVKLLSGRKFSSLSRFQGYVDDCKLPNAEGLTGTEKLFLTPKYSSMTCPHTIQGLRTLEDPVTGLKAKINHLIGHELSDDFIAKGNPFAELDMSKAPKLEAILISYLVFRKDFYGALLSRLIKWHADQGSIVRIMVAEVISLEKDLGMLRDLQESSNNIRVHVFKYNSQSLNPLDHVTELHRTMHVKLFITLGEEEENNLVIFGGRNIHDGFIFKSSPDHTAFPELVQYGPGKDENFIHWRDFEMEVISKDLAEKVAAHYLTLWEMDSRKFSVRSLNINEVSAEVPSEDYFKLQEGEEKVRHYLSVPFKDGHALEELYVDLFDSAQKEVKLSTPYFRPTKKIGEAIIRAVERGVKISLITRLDMKGDTADIILSDVNKAGVNKFFKQIKIFEYTEPSVILHSKLVLIDGKFSFIGSVNMNKRSFYHDTENGVMVYGPRFHEKMASIMETYYTTSKEIPEKLKIVLWKRMVIGVFDKEF